jgi:alpha-mannosidase
LHLHLREVPGRNPEVAVLEATLGASDRPRTLTYGTRVGALLRVDGIACGAFDREHRRAELAACAVDRTVALEVERQSLPTNGLPSGRGFSWWLLNATSHPAPAMEATVEPCAPDASNERRAGAGGDLTLWGHSHLDVAWLWTYAQTRRKAARTFANALALLDAFPSFVFMQSQPQLYRFVQEDDPELFARVAIAARAGRFDPDVAAMWVEPDCNLPSGESLIRQMLHAHTYCVREFDAEPSIAWLPDSFGFANTLPTLLAHCGIERFATTKLQWNDTTRFPFPRFVWRGPDGSEVIGALIDSYDGGFSPARATVARERNEPIVAGFGDGGGGVTREMLDAAPALGHWQRPGKWFAALESRRDTLPLHADELYLEYHRGVYTTHHDVKAHNASLERRLAQAEELAAWCVAIRAPAAALENLSNGLRDAWQIVLRNQFHDVLPGTSIRDVYEDVVGEYARANEHVDRTIAATRSMLPRAARRGRADRSCAPARDGDAWRFDNGLIGVRVLDNGTIVHCAAAGGKNIVAQANALALYRDRPAKWEAWNVDAGYERSRRAGKPGAASVVDDALQVPFDLGRSGATMRIGLMDGEPFLRVDLTVDWRERRRLLRVENWLPLAAPRATYGSPHGTIERSTRRDTPQERSKFEVPGQRFAVVRDDDGAGLAIFSLDTYGWSARTLEAGGVRVGHSLLRGTTWPDEHADLGRHDLAWAFVPLAPGVSIGTLERTWQRFAHEPRVLLFRCSDDSVLVTCCKPAEDGDGVIVRVRECDGIARSADIFCGGRMRAVEAVDGLERPLSGQPLPIQGEAFVATLPAFGLRTYRVRF